VPILDSGIVLLAPGIGKLQEILALPRASFVYLPAEFAPELNLVVVIDEGVVRQDAAMFERSASNSAIDCPSTPAAPWLAFTRLKASQTSRFGMMNGLASFAGSSCCQLACNLG
jgi:hypothetical protein